MKNFKGRRCFEPHGISPSIDDDRMILLTTNHELEEAMKQAAKLNSEDKYSELMEYLSRLRFSVSSALPVEDVFSDEYMQWVESIYFEISGRSSYDPWQNEQDINLEIHNGLKNPFPFCTGDPVTIGNYLAAIGLIVKALALPRGAKVLEYGIGWAHTTLCLARAGYEVTGVDVEEKFLRLAQMRAERKGVSLRVHRGLFGDVPLKGERFDAVLFFECFHHCLDHARITNRIANDILKDGGKIVFCGEPFYGEWFPYPWGLRVDGHSLWAIRQMGWMELGFRESYIRGLLESNGFEVVTTTQENMGALGLLCIATKR